MLGNYPPSLASRLKSLVTDTSAPPCVSSGLPPSVVSIHLEGEMQAGATITAEYKYVGGLEGVSHYGWYLHEVSGTRRVGFMILKLRTTSAASTWLNT